MKDLVKLRLIVADDALAITFQTLAQYRGMLLSTIDKELKDYLPCMKKECKAPYTRASIGCDTCTYNKRR